MTPNTSPLFLLAWLSPRRMRRGGFPSGFVPASQTPPPQRGFVALPLCAMQENSYKSVLCGGAKEDLKMPRAGFCVARRTARRSVVTAGSLRCPWKVKLYS